MKLAHKHGSADNTHSNSFQEDIARYLPYLLADTLGGGDLMGSDRCVKALEELEELEELNKKGKEEKEKILLNLLKFSGWRFSTARCLSDAQILGHLLYKDRAIKGETIPGYILRRGDDVMDQLKGFEALNRVQGYILGQLHQRSPRPSRRRVC